MLHWNGLLLSRILIRTGDRIRSGVCDHLVGDDVEGSLEIGLYVVEADSCRCWMVLEK